MKYSTAFAAFAVFGLASAQSLDSIPQCARQCLGPAIQETGCSETDVACFCKPENMEKIISAGTGCVLQSCGQETALNEVLPAITKVCESASGATNTFLPGTTMPTTGGVTTIASPTAPSTGVTTTDTLVSGIPTFRPTSTDTTLVSTPTTQPGANGTGGTNGTTTSSPPSAGAPRLTGLNGVAMMALAFFAAY